MDSRPGPLTVEPGWGLQGVGLCCCSPAERRHTGIQETRPFQGGEMPRHFRSNAPNTRYFLFPQNLLKMPVSETNMINKDLNF